MVLITYSGVSSTAAPLLPPSAVLVPCRTARATAAHEAGHAPPLPAHQPKAF